MFTIGRHHERALLMSLGLPAENKRDLLINGRTIIVLPGTLIAQWKEEAYRWAPSYKEPLVVMNKRDLEKFREAIENQQPGEALLFLVSQRALVMYKDEFLRHEYGIMIVDEARYLTRNRGKRVAAVRELRKRCRKCLLLTGTPYNSNKSRHEDMRRLVAVATGAVDRSGHRESDLELALQYQDRFSRLRAEMIFGEVVTTTSRADVASDIPPINPITTVINPDAEEAIVIKAMVEKAMSYLEKIDVARKALQEKGDQIPPEERKQIQSKIASLRSSALSLFRALSADITVLGASQNKFLPLIVEQLGQDIPVLRDLLEGTRPTSKSQRVIAYMIDKRLDSDGEARFLIFAKNEAPLKVLENQLKAAGFKCAVLSGSTPKPQLEKVKKDFQNGKIDALLLAGPSMAYGHNLQRANVVINYDLPEDIAEAEQRIGRAARIGNEASNVDVFTPIVQGLNRRAVERLVSQAVANLSLRMPSSDKDKANMVKEDPLGAIATIGEKAQEANLKKDVFDRREQKTDIIDKTVQMLRDMLAGN